MSWLPGVSQIKSVFQLVTLDFDGAVATQKEFFQKCPIVSQVTAGVQLAVGEKDAAKKTWDQGLGTVNGVVNGIPVVGHVKGAIHLMCDDQEGAIAAFKSSTRTTGKELQLLPGAGSNTASTAFSEPKSAIIHNVHLSWLP